MVPFNIPTITGNEHKYLNGVFSNKKFCGKGPYTFAVQNKISKILKSEKSKVLFTTSCTDALEMAAILINIMPGDEVIMPSYTFVSTANAFVMRGAVIVFVDIEPKSMNMNVDLVEAAITDRTKAIVCVHYAGMCGRLEYLKNLCIKKSIVMIEDAAQALSSTFLGQSLGTWGDISTFSFHDTKNYHCGEGGALVINNPQYFERAEILIEKGTDRTKFLSGQVDHYSWQDIGSSYLGSELNAAFLFAQLESIDVINQNRKTTWETYSKKLENVLIENEMSFISPIENCVHNAHLFGIVLSPKHNRDIFLKNLKAEGVTLVTHFTPLHSSAAGLKYTRFHGEDRYTTNLSRRLCRLPMYFGMKEHEIELVTNKIIKYLNF